MIPVVLLADATDSESAGVREIQRELASAHIKVLLPEVTPRWWPNESLQAWADNHPEIGASRRAAVVGIGSGGQAALRTAFVNGRDWPIVAAIAPACDLGRWYGRGTTIDTEYASADAARQDEAPLYFNPLSRPAHQLCWCDRRDEACLPSALRVVSKCESSGVPITSDLESEIGGSRDEYVRLRAGELVEWIVDRQSRLPIGPDLTVIQAR